MNKPESIFLLQCLQAEILNLLQVLGPNRPQTLAQIQRGFPGASGDILQTAIDALIAAGAVRRVVDTTSFFAPPEYVATSTEGGPDDV